MPSMRQTSSPAGCFERLKGKVSALPSTAQDEDDQLLDPNAEEPNVEVSPNNNINIHNDTEFSGLTAAEEPRNEAQNSPDNRCPKLRKFARAASVFLLTNAVASIFIMLNSAALGGVLGYLALRNGNLQIDKTVKSFTIPNHVASRHQDALEVAIKEMRKNRFKRDLNDLGIHEESHKAKESQYTNVLHSKELDLDDDGLFEIYTGTEFQKSLSHSSDTRKISEREFRHRLKESLKENFKENVIHSKNFNTNRHRQKRQTMDATGRISETTQMHRRWKMQLVYLALGDDKNIFTPERLETIRQVERAVMDHKDFVNFCHIHYKKWEEDPNLDRYRGCSPLNSLLTYFYPSKTPDGMVHFDSLGNTLNDINKTLSLAMTHDSFFWYVDENINAANRRSRILRSEVHFGAPLPYFESFGDRKKEQQELYIDFVVSYIDTLSKLSTDKVKVLYGGNELFDYEVDSTFWNDIRLALFTLCFIVIFMFVLTSFSLWLTFCGIFSILLSFPVALYFYHIVFGVESLGILNGVASFVIIGIGVDDVFVFVNTFRQSHALQDHYTRMIHTIKTAGSATFFTSFTTAAAFAANVASSIPAVHDFGLFMSLIVGGCWLTVFVFIPPSINIWAKCFAKCESLCYRGCTKCNRKSKLHISAEMNAFLQHSASTSSTATSGISSFSSLPSSQEMSASVARSTDDADDALLQIEDVSNHEGGWPIYLGMLNQDEDNQNTDEMLLEDDDPLLSLENELNQELEKDNSTSIAQKEGCSLNVLMQAFLYTYVGKPVVKVRWFILGAYLVILAISIGLVTQLTSATKPPQLFKPTTNLQMLVDLAANFSDDSINCDDCSGFYKEGSVQPNEPTFMTTVSLGMVTTVTRKSPNDLPGSGSSSKKPIPNDPNSSSSLGTTTADPQLPTSKGIATAAASVTVATEKQQPTPSMSSATSSSASSAKPATLTPLPTIPPGITDKVIPTLATNPTTSSSITHNYPHGSSWTPPSTDPDSIGTNYDPCANGRCKDIKNRPILETGAVIYVVFGIVDIDRSNVSYKHVLTDKGQVVYDDKFYDAFISRPDQAVADLCRICKAIANNSDLVRPNSSQCLPPYGLSQTLRKWISTIPQCQGLPDQPTTVNGRALPARAIAGKDSQGYMKWIAMAFESTTFKGQSYFSAYSEYQKWEKFITRIKTKVIDKDSPLQSMYQTSDFWESVMMEIVTVSSATYGLVLSMVICIAAVAIFTAHILLLIVVVMTIVGVICLVVGIFYLAGWEMGAVEAVSLSILVGSSVDYCVHLVEGFLLSGKNIPPNISQDKAECRKWRALAAISHIGVSITSSAITTIVAAIPLCMTVIQPFSKFGQIVTINTSISILYTLTACVAFLSLMGPPKFRVTWRSYAISFLITTVVISFLVLILFIISKAGIDIPAPNGQNLF